MVTPSAGLKLGLLGTAGALASARRANTSLVLVAQSALLVDCAGNAVGALERLGVDWPRLEHLVLTHRHIDHLAGLPSLVDQMWLATRATGRGALTLWGPPSALEVGRELLRAAGLLARPSMFELRLEPLAPREHRLTLGDLDVTLFPVEHGDVPTLGLCAHRVGEPDRAIVCSSDTGPCDAVLGRARHARLLVHECSSLDEAHFASHSTLDELEARLAQIGPPETLLVHLPRASLALEREVEARLRARFGARVRLGQDGEVCQI